MRGREEILAKLRDIEDEYMMAQEEVRSLLLESEDVVEGTFLLNETDDFVDQRRAAEEHVEVVRTIRSTLIWVLGGV